MKKEFLKIVYGQWEDETGANTEMGNEIDESINTISRNISQFKGKWMDTNQLLELEAQVNAVQANIHRAGFYTGFETACKILREMVGVE